MSFLLPFVNICGAISSGFYWVLYLLDSYVYELVAFSYKIFTLMCTINFNSLYGLVSPLIDRLNALIIVFIVFNLGSALIQYLLNPEKAVEGGTKFLKNLFIATAMLVSYSFVFSVTNEVSILLIGNSTGYKYTTLGEIFDLNDEDGNGKKDPGLIMRFIFGEDAGKQDPGETIALNLLKTFIKDTELDANSEYVPTDSSAQLEGKINNRNDGSLNLTNLPSLKDVTDKNQVYFNFLVSFVVGLFVVYSTFSASIQIGIRMFKLLILQVLAPIAIIDVIKNGFDGKFKNFMKTYGSVFLEAIVRMATLLVISVFVSKFVMHINDYFPALQGEESVITKSIITVIVVIAAYTFSGQVPKFIDGIIGTNMGEGAKTNFGHFLTGMLGAGVGFAAGARTGNLAGMISGAVGGATTGYKGKSVSDFFKGMSDNSAKARNVAAGAMMAGGSLAYGLSRAESFMGIPQRKLEKGKLAGERKTAMENMLKTMDDNYDKKIRVGGPKLDKDGNVYYDEVGLDRNKFNTDAYKTHEEWDDTIKENVTKFDGQYASALSEETKQEIKSTKEAYENYTKAQSDYDDAVRNGGNSGEAYKKLEEARTVYQTLKDSTDKKIDTDFNSMMIKDMSSGKYVKDKGKSAVKSSINSYDNIASSGYKTSDISSGKTNTKKASDEYTKQQDRANNSSSATRYNNINSRK